MYLVAEGLAETDSLVLVGTPGVRLPQSAEVRRRIARVRRMKRISRYMPAPVRRNIEARLARLGSEDYRQAGDMRPILVRVVNEDLRELLPSIALPTLLMWGAKDDAAPLQIGQIMEEAMPGAGLVVFDESGHFPYLDEPAKFSAVIRSFLASMTKKDSAR